MIYSMSILLLAITGLSILLLALFGEREERMAAGLFIVVMIVTPYLQPLGQGTFRWAVALSSALLFGFLLWRSLKADRWWLLAAAGCQLLALSTHLLPLIRMDALIWSTVTVRWVSWMLLMLISAFGAWEAWSLGRIRH